MSEHVVTRFAPSPTGYLHVGGARTALFNWLWARRMAGTFILRIEDTDQKRNTPTAAKQVMDDLRWLGIDWDEGPDVDGPNGPYFQSQRKDIYDRYVKQLLDTQKAYYCFETPEELESMRREAEAQKKGFVYRRPAELPTAEQAETMRTQGRTVTVRFALPQDQPLVVNDLVRGQIRFAPEELGDFIVQKSDGFPTYNFACVVDDCLMGVTDVIRGQEHLMNTPGQQALWQALFPDTAPPRYAHMSVTISDAGGKLSKRERPKALLAAIQAAQDIDVEALASVGGIYAEQMESFLQGESTLDMPRIDAIAAHLGVHLPEINIVDFLKSGYLPETMVNFLALLGWNPGDQREVMSRRELIDSFDPARLTKSNSLFDRGKLLAFNTEHIKTTEEQTLRGHLRAYLEVVDSPIASADDALLARIIRSCQGARTLEEIERKCRFLFIGDDEVLYDDKAVKKTLLRGRGLEFLAVVRDQLNAVDVFSEDAIETMLRSIAEQQQVGLGKVAQPLRVAICGTTISPPIFDSVDMLGKDKTLRRIDLALARFRASDVGVET